MNYKKAKQVIFILLSILSFSSTAHEISIKINGLNDQEVILGYHFGSKKYVLDTLDQKATNTFVIEGQKPLKKGLYFIYAPSFYFEFLVVEQQFSVEITTSDPYQSMTIEGSNENRLFKDFQIKMGGHQRLMADLQKSLSIPGIDSTAVQNQMDSISNQLMNSRHQLIDENPDTYLADFLRFLDKAPILKGGQLDSVTVGNFRVNYLSRISDPSVFMRTPVFHSYVVNYFQNIVVPIPDNVNSEIDRWLEKCESDSSTYRYWLTQLLSTYQEPKIMGMDAVWIHLIENYCLNGKAYWLPEKTIAELRTEVIFIKPNLIGTSAPSFYAIDTTGNSLNFKSFQNDFYVLFFYDPGCSHCRQKTPILNKQHEQIKEWGGRIIGICTTTLKDELIDFIDEFDLEWTHLWDPDGESDFRVKYNTRTTPQLYILDKNFKIIAKQLDVGKVAEFIESQKDQ